jgi:hypothetical protein
MYKKLGIFVAVMTILGGLYGGALAVGFPIDRPVWKSEFIELEQIVAGNQEAINLQRWQFLSTKKINFELTTAEILEFCKLTKLLFDKECE